MKKILSILSARSTGNASFASFVKGELKDWYTGEIIWLVFCTAAVTGLSIYMQETAIGIIAAVTSLLYTLLAGKGKISCYIFGVINVILYGWISYQHRFFGEVMLNIFYYLPMMFVGFFLWKHKRDDSRIIHKTALSVRGRIGFIAASAAGIAGYAMVLKYLNGSQPWIDSTTTVLSITAMIFTAKRCIEQWILWTIVNSLSMYMWFVEYNRGNGGLAMFFMWTLLLLNGIIFFVQWYINIRKSSASPTAGE